MAAYYPRIVLALGQTAITVVLLLMIAAGLLVVLVFLRFGMLWLQAHMSSAPVRMANLIGMSLRQVNPGHVVTAQIMARQSGLAIGTQPGQSTARLEAHVLAGGDISQVLRAIIVAQRAGIDLDFDRAAAIDLAGRDVLDAVRTSVSPKIIDCPNPDEDGKALLSAFAQNGVELRIRVRVTVRTNLKQLIGGATEDTIIARVGQGIISAIGSSHTHMDVMEMPNRISQAVLSRGLDSNTAFEIVSIDIADIEVGENIGARLQGEQAEADTRKARAQAEARRANAIASQLEMTAQVTKNRARLVLAEAHIPPALAAAFRAGRCSGPSVRSPMALLVNLASSTAVSTSPAGRGPLRGETTT